VIRPFGVDPTMRRAAHYLCTTGDKIMATRTRKPTRKSHSTTVREYRFQIDAYSPETMPLSRLAEYLQDLSVLFGESQSVHLIKIEKGSTVPVLRVEREAETKVRERLRLVRTNEGPPEAMRAAKQIDERLRRDGAKAVVTDPINSKVIEFRGRELNRLVEYGPFSQPGRLDGIPVMIGGIEEDYVPVHLRGRQKEVYNCYAKHSVAKDLAPYLFSDYVRVEGTGRWIRHRNGDWEMKRFTIKDFSPLKGTTLRETIEELRAIPAEWKKLDDPYAELARIRHGT